MKINDLFNLEKDQRQLDFINIDVDQDLPLFLDPYFLSTNNDFWSISAYKTIQNYFQTVISLLKEGNYDQAKRLFQYLSEPNETCLGVSTGNPQGRGVGTDEATRIFEHIINSRAVESGIVGHLEDVPIFVENIGKDKISDLTTNVIRKHLIEYTQNQCQLHGIELTQDVPSGYYWNDQSLSWENTHTEMLVIKGKKILLVPKGVVSFSIRYTPERYCDHFVLNFLQNEHVRLRTSLIRVEKLKSGEVKIHPPSKKKLKETENANSKEYLREFTKEHPEVYQRFRESIKNEMDPLSNTQVEEDLIDLESFVNQMKDELSNIPSGTKNANKFHDHIVGVLAFLFYPQLICPVKEQEIHEGRKRIDITFDNAAREGFFHQLHDVKKIPSQYIFVECKNYSSEITNPELDQLSGRFSVNRGMAGFLVCRHIENKDLFIKRCTDTYKDNRGLIIPIDDTDLQSMLSKMKDNGHRAVDSFLNDRVREIILK
ncbi:hypothetical protein [Tenuibacillus multivorans]|uniref:Restriction endonuclease n=1 Tax=Tenuibacillus multivorans TaxID=237069 RepID=A0A1G9YIK4_9BACI|nr:hypothetical protein [Tenuibacillus multivorans]GEL78696.1 hypothetical protein TMU01_29310 [Tenuibacillus multivorans]SDN08907.1 hypothetical protein SAMN05216498_1422 [Tenuibacillus multivorans]